MAEHSMCQPGPAPAPWRVPARLFRRRQFPQHEVLRVFLVPVDLDARARDLLVERTFGKLPIVFHRRRIEQHFACRFIGMAAFNQALNQADHVGLAVAALDELRGARLVCRRQAAKRRDILLILVVRRPGDLADRLVQAELARLDLLAEVAQSPCVDLVVDVGDVAHIGDFVSPLRRPQPCLEMAQQPKQHVEHDRRARIADMGEVVDRRAADIHAHVVRVDRDKVLLRPRQRIVKSQLRLRHRLLSGMLLPEKSATFREHALPWPAGLGVCPVR